jgi:peptidoglycan-associated lipoprotein
MWSDPIPLGETINSEGEEGTPCLNKDYTVMYYAGCKQSKNKNLGCNIYTSKRSGEGWGASQPLDLGFTDSVVVAHPAISPDELTLYFVSDMPGGQGETDIWKVTREDVNAKWGSPVNLGSEINTTGSEKFPYVHHDGTLYFSSNGLPGLGGLDIFRAKQAPDGHWKVENMRYPINSQADDFGITFQSDKEEGYFSSTRGRKDDDIYLFVLPPLRFEIMLYVKDEKKQDNLSESSIKVVSSDGITADYPVNQEGIAKIQLKPNTDYVFIASSKGHLNGKKRLSTKGLNKNQTFSENLLLASIDKPIELPNIFYDFGSWQLRPESMTAMDVLVETLNDNPNITIELSSNTDNRGSDKANTELSQKRAQSVVNYLIEKGIAADRLTAKGYGESKPRTVDEAMNKQYAFLPVGTVLNEAFINSLEKIEEQEIAHQLNRRTEFKVLRTDYIPKK